MLSRLAPERMFQTARRRVSRVEGFPSSPIASAFLLIFFHVPTIFLAPSRIRPSLQ